MIRFPATFRKTAGSTLLIVLTGYAVMTLLWQSIRLYPDLPEKDPVTIHEERIRQLKPFLPASGEVGYVTTVENDRIFADEKTFRNVEYLAQYVLTQYTLAPAHRPKLARVPAGHREFSRRSTGARIPGEKRPRSRQGFRGRPDSLPEGAHAVIVTFIASLLVALGIGTAVVYLFPPAKSGAAGTLLRLSAGGGFGIGITSCVYFICLLGGLVRYIVAVEIVLGLVLGLLCLSRFRKGTPREEEAPAETDQSVHGAVLSFTGSKLRTLVAFVFSAELIASLVSFFIAFLKEPHGRWDAWLIWNMHARFLFRGGTQWREAFASGLDWSHWDYPLLLPLSIARGWTYLGGEGFPVPAVMGFLFTFLVLGLLAGALVFLRSRTQGYLAAMVLMGTPFFIFMGSSQFADVPLAFFILATLVMLFLPARSPAIPAGPVILAGLAAGLCAWTKNEGLLFVPLVTGCLLIPAAVRGGWRGALQRTAWFLAGALPVLMIVIIFKLRLAPANDLMAGLSLEALSGRLFDWDRYAAIARAFFVTGISFTQGLIDVRVGMQINPGAVSVLLLAVYLLLTGVKTDVRDRTGLIETTSAVCLTLVGYFFVYVLTPLDLNYHLATSLNRLFLQLWPGIIFLVFMIAAPPEQVSRPLGNGPANLAAQSKQSPLQRKKQKKNVEAK